MRLDRLHRAYPSLHPFGVVHWVPVLSNIKTTTGCESNRQLQLRTVFAGTVVNNYQFNGIQGWAGQLMSNKMPGCHLANAWRSRSSECLKKSFETHSSVAVLYRNEVSVHSFIHAKPVRRIPSWYITFIRQVSMVDIRKYTITYVDLCLEFPTIWGFFWK